MWALRYQWFLHEKDIVSTKKEKVKPSLNNIKVVYGLKNVFKYLMWMTRVTSVSIFCFDSIVECK